MTKRRRLAATASLPGTIVLAMALCACEGVLYVTAPSDSDAAAIGDSAPWALADGSTPDAASASPIDAAIVFDAGTPLPDAGAPAPRDAAPPRDAGTTAPAPNPCDHITPRSDPAANVTTIQRCLDAGHAYLATGTFPLASGLRVHRATLRGAGRTATTLQLGVTHGTHVIVTMGTAGRVENLGIDGRNAFAPGPVMAQISFTGNDSRARSVRLWNSSGTTRRSTGVYFVCETCTGNVVDDALIFDSFYGVIFRSTLTAAHVNTVRNSTIRDTPCDGVTFAGFGRVQNTTFVRNGYDCENPVSPGRPPIPGAPFYCADSTAGGVFEGNTASDSCGHLIDVDTCDNLVFRNNDLRNPGYQWGGTYPYCGGGSAMFLLDVRNTTVEGNTVVLGDRPQNRVSVAGDPNRVFSRRGGAVYSDLPAGGNTMVAFVLARRNAGGQTTMNNHVRDNVLRANCSGSCVGLGYFTSRDTGYDAAGGWSAATTNYFLRNNPFGSQVGSARCGGNWFAGSSTCTATHTDPDCNTDDRYFTAMFHNGNCPRY